MACKGGQPSSVCDYVMKFGIASDSNYKYLARKDYCRAQYHQNKTRRKTGARVLEQLFSGPMKPETKPKERVLQGSGYSNIRHYEIKYDNEKEQYYYKLIMTDGSIKYIDVNRRPFIPSSMSRKPKSTFPSSHTTSFLISRLPRSNHENKAISI